MNDKRPNSRRNLDIAINKLKIGQKNPLQIRVIIANTIVGQLLPSGTVKGGSALKFRYGDQTTRFTRDLDASSSVNLSDFIEKLDASLKTGWNGFSGKILRKEPAKPKNVPPQYVMQPFEIKMEYNGKSWITISLEIGHDEIGDTDSPDKFISQDIISIFEQLGFPAPKPIALMPIHHQIAQKIHAISTENNERAHDLIDLQVIAQNETINFSLLKTTCKRLFAYRKMQKWPPLIIKGHNWDSLYASQIVNLDVLQTVDEAIVWANSLISQIENSTKTS